MKTAVIFGVFDLTHYGHYRKFEMLKDKGYNVLVGVVTDEFTQTYKRKPIMTTFERMENVIYCKYVDSVFKSHGKFVAEVEDLKQVDLIIHGGDWSREAYMKHMGFTEEWLTKNKIVLEQVPYTKGVSTTQIIERIRENGS